MTEQEEAELTDGQGRALSAHRSKAYERYANVPVKFELNEQTRQALRRLPASVGKKAR
jgi:hypothetical protein